MTKRIAFHTLGCKLNFAETAGISRQFAPEGYTQVDFHEEADIYVIHSCTVTVNAEKKTIAAIRQSHKRNPAAHIAVIGCMSELDPDRLRQQPGVQWVLGNNDKYKLNEILEQQAFPTNEDPSLHFYPSWSINERTRSFLKIQDGCDYFCSYCTIPLARGRSRSATIAQAMQSAREIAAAGMKEIVLTGINIGDFGRHQQENLYTLLQQMETLKGIERIRISSIEPDLLDDRIIRMAGGDSKLQPHFHIPLQSGSDAVLRMMNRKYSVEDFRRKVETIRQALPMGCIATDIIAGFPGETDELFQETYDFINTLDLSYMHVFTYSERRNTKALRQADPVPPEQRKSRGRRLQEISNQKKEAFYMANKNRHCKVFFESENKNGYLYGFTDNYIRARIPFTPALVNSIASVMLTKLANKDCFTAELT